MALTRRRLLIGTGVGAGLLVGWAAWPRRHAISWAAADDEVVLNAFLKVGLDGRVVVAVPQAEMGQGIWSGLAQIAADELGADWKTVSVEPAPLGAAYANRFALGEMTSGLPAPLRGPARWTTDRVVEYFEMQMTGGSTSVRGFEAPLRAAGAVAREMLCRAAANRLSIEWTECGTDNGFVTHKANRIAFAELVKEAALLDPPRTATLRPIRTISGTSVPRIDLPSKVDGSAQFGADVRLPGMHYAAIAQGPIGAKRTRIDKAKLPAGCQLVEQPGFVAVVARGWWQAKQGLDALVISYDRGETPAGPWMEAALDAALDSQDGLETALVRDDADAVELLAGPVEGVIGAEFALPFLAHACMETMTATARIEDGRCELWTPTQSLTITTWAVARALGIADEAVTVYPTLLGGGFGRKIETDAAMQAALIARAVGKPVQLIWSREEDFAHDFWRPAVAARLRGRVTGEGAGARITALAARVAVPDVGASAIGRNLPRLGGSPKAGAQALEGMVRFPYDVPSVALEHVLVNVAVPLGFWRSVGNSYTAFITESFIDELAASAGVDPGGFRLQHLGDKPRHAAVVRALTSATGALGRERNGDGSTSGTGMALWESFGSIVGVAAEVVVRGGEPPQVVRLIMAADCGRVINPDSVRAQLEGAAIFGLSAALSGRASFADGEVLETNFDRQPLLGLAATPVIEIILIESEEAPGGVGEVGTPPVAPALANAIFAASGIRMRRLPLGGPLGERPLRTGASTGAIDAASGAATGAALETIDSGAEMAETPQ
ncbi:isoquinoline 1-oxidoreductase beta subunit [Polymorphobacter multimanifer]|uniref:Isoquinoline 1-oxidoreductase beta subunit n=1 Tax=Polymorphobacter multimanifer TaxID=1070431 RepID=A0A841L8G6_9SPHN|nr:molybdopterin cofactor-binding domain-containing protein [Polymorphobacter multimanifer]MBB6228927.1 isoquinoline 1-oxidoreductase beta subunit [Polymorphobacter multimanifer]